MKLALIGTGMIVKEVLPVLETIDGISLEAIVSTPRSLETARVLADRYGIKTATSLYDEVLNSSAIDTVYVAVPNHLHYTYAKQALLAGKHVICEKPFTMNGHELDDLMAIAHEKGLILLEAITNQHLPNYYLIKEFLPKLGDIKIVNCNYSQYSSRYDAFKRGDIAPAFDPEKGGGALRDLNIYNIHLVVGLFGQPLEVIYLPNMENQIDTSGILVLDYGTFKAVCIGSKDSSAPITSVIQGNKGNISILGPTNSLPEINFQENGQQSERFNNNSNQHRMYDEFVAFEVIIRTNDLEQADELLKHSRNVMAVLDLAVEGMTR